MKKIDKLIFTTMTLAWTIPIVFFSNSYERWYVFNTLTNALSWVFTIDKNSQYPIDNVVFNTINLISAIIFVIYFIRVLTRKSYNTFLLILEFFCLAMFSYRFYIVIRFSSYGEFYPPYAIALELLPILFYCASFMLTLYKITKSYQRRPTKAERLQAQIDQLQKQVDELKKGD